MKKLMLTSTEWEIVEVQCSACKFWDDEDGCQTSQMFNPYPQSECSIFARKGDASLPWTDAQIVECEARDELEDLIDERPC